MNNKIILSFIFGIMLLSLCSANLGTFKQNECVDIKTILNTSAVTLSTLSYPNGNIIVSEKAMSNSVGLTWNYTNCLNSQIGFYNYDYYDAENNVYVNTYEITPSGFTGTLGFYIIILLIASASILLGFKMTDHWFVIVGGIGFLLIGLYSINYGIAGMRDMFITWGTGLFEIFMGGYLAIRAGLEISDGDDL